MVTATPMQVLLHIRGDAERKPGGDYSLIKTFAGLLRERGHIVTTAIGDAPIPERCDVVLTINLDSPFEPWLMLQRAKRRSIPVCLYSLHHPYDGFASYLRHGTSGARRAAALLAGFQPQRYLGVLATARTLLTAGNRSSCLHAGRIRSLQSALLSECAAVLVSSRLEHERILVDFPGSEASARLVMVPHAFARHSVSSSQRDRHLVVCPGRIESRKNQLAILRVAKDFPDRRFTFVGSLNASEGAYCRRFLAMIADTPNATHVDGLPLDQFRSLLASAGVAVSASWFEVVSLAELEALAQGCRLVATRHSYLPEFAAGRVELCDPSSSTELTAALTRACTAGADTPPPADFLANVDPRVVGDALAACLWSCVTRTAA